MSPIVKILIAEKIRKVYVELNSLHEDGTFYEAFGDECDSLLSGICNDLDVLSYDISQSAYLT